ncbi:MAG TPA: hypothetical protein VNS81_06535 [Nocardioides sp.]|nr:hypothetical protein [Nocardioides sp.]
MSDTERALNRLRIKHKRFAEETNRLLTEQHNEITRLRTELGRRFRHLYDSPDLPAFYRVFLFGVDHHGVPLERGQLHNAVDPQRLIRSAEISRAIRHAIGKGMLDPSSSARMLLVAQAEEDVA